MQTDTDGAPPDAPAGMAMVPHAEPEGGGTEAAFAAELLRALSDMAARSKRRQADVIAALRGAGLAAEPARVRSALRLLQRFGCIENLVPLADGGVLLSVLPAALEKLAPVPQLLSLVEEG